MAQNGRAAAPAYHLIYHPAPAEHISVLSGQHGCEMQLQDIAADLYKSVTCLSLMLRVHGAHDSAMHALQLVSTDGITHHVVFFQVERASIRVANRFLPLDDDLVGRVSRFIFETFSNVLWIEFDNSILHDVTATHHSFHVQGITYYIRSLPDHFDAFLKSIGQNANQNYRRYMKKAQKDLGLRLEVAEKDKLDRAVFDQIIELKNAQLKRAGNPPLKGAFPEALFKAHQRYGVSILLYSQDRLAAAYITTIAGAGCEFWTTAYDADYSKYWLGNIAGIEAIRAAIDQNCHQYNFLWGRTDHKLMLGGEPRSLHNFVVAKHMPAKAIAFLNVALYRPASVFAWRGLHYVTRRIKRVLGTRL